MNKIINNEIDYETDYKINIIPTNHHKTDEINKVSNVSDNVMQEMTKNMFKDMSKDMSKVVPKDKNILNVALDWILNHIQDRNMMILVIIIIDLIILYQ